MVKPVMKDVFFLMQKSEPAVKSDLSVGQDLRDTLAFHRAGCVGMAANMIGVRKRIIIVNIGQADLVMFNPVILSRSGAYEAEEGCLSLEGTRKATRFRQIEVEYRDESWKKRTCKLNGWTAQICQHELDHLDGILI